MFLNRKLLRNMVADEDLVGPEKIPALGNYVFKLFLPHWALCHIRATWSLHHHAGAKRLLKLCPFSSNMDWMKEKEDMTDMPAGASTEVDVVPLDKRKTW